MMSSSEAGVEHGGNIWMDDDPKRITISILFTSLLLLPFYSRIPKIVEKTRILLILPSCHSLTST